jgi:uncharacterized protein (DUF885 family)
VTADAGRRTCVAALAAGSALAGCVSLPDEPPPAPSSVPGTDAAAARLRSLLQASDEAMLERNPITAMYRGDLRLAAQHGDYISTAYVEAERQAAERDLAMLATIPRDRLSPDDRVAYDTFRWSRVEARARHRLPAAAIWPRLKLDQINGWHLFFAVLSSGEGVAPYRTVKDYEDGLARLDGFVAYLDRAVARMREGMAAGVVQPRVVVDRLAGQFERFAGQDVDTSPYYGPIRKLPPEIPVADRERLAKAYAAALQDKLRPAFRRVHEFLAGRYRAAARETVGIGVLPGGKAYYEWLVRAHTTTNLSPDEVHRIGLAEVDRLTRGMHEVMKRVGYGGTLQQFFEHLRTDPSFRPASAQALADGYRAIGRRVEAAMPRLFDLRPVTPLEIRPTPDYQAPTDAAARYDGGSPDIGRPGVFYFNTYDLASRNLSGMETLYLHEAVPGHHFQTMIAAENMALPKLLRYDGNTAFIEGWALYAETLGPELGLFEDPYQLFGHYGDQMLRAVRLVVDTGLHAFGWTREQAFEYMLARSAIGRTDAMAEVERYIVDPGQALAYKIGERTIRRLRDRAEQALGTRFDVRAFHAQVLRTGSIPLAVLESKIEDWIAMKTRQAV